VHEKLQGKCIKQIDGNQVLICYLIFQFNVFRNAS